MGESLPHAAATTASAARSTTSEERFCMTFVYQDRIVFTRPEPSCILTAVTMLRKRMPKRAKTGAEGIRL